mmetsp:Transcript_20117/g.35342  ORF Transcript_20117/g.35342 Transcript_20117/m.35342 type:complete len:114 (-) Transcript_20117:85-426(-)
MMCAYMNCLDEQRGRGQWSQRKTLPFTCQSGLYQFSGLALNTYCCVQPFCRRKRREHHHHVSQLDGILSKSRMMQMILSSGSRQTKPAAAANTSALSKYAAFVVLVQDVIIIT